MKEYRIETKIKNNLIYKRITDMGFDSISEFCRQNKICQSAVGSFINMKESPFAKDGQWKNTPLMLSEIFGCLPDDLFTENQIEHVLETNKHSSELSKEQVDSYLSITSKQEIPLLEDSYYEEQKSSIINDSLRYLSPIERQVLELRFGLNGQKEHTLGYIGKIFNFTSERIRQIEAKALRKLRNPNNKELKIRCLS